MTDQKIKLSIIIASWNVQELLQQCLESIFNNQPAFSFEVIVVDNASKDQSVGLVMNQFPQVRLITNQKNLGFARANNQAVKIAQGDFILLLNPDTVILAGTLDKTVNYLEQNKEIGVLGCQLLNPDKTLQPSLRRLPTLGSQLLILLKLHRLFPKLKSLRNYFATDLDYSKVQEAGQVMGAFMLIRKKLIDKLGLFDERFYLWFEEVDLCKRVKDDGQWKVIYYPEAAVIHYGGQSFVQEFRFKNQFRFNNSLLDYFRKHKYWLSFVVILIFYSLSLLLALMLTPFISKKKEKIKKDKKIVDVSKFKMIE